MKIVLHGGPQNTEVLKELLSSRGINIVEKSPISFVPRGKPLPDKGIVVVYDTSQMDELINFIDSIKNLFTQSNKEIIIGKKKEGYAVLQLPDIIYFVALGNYVYSQTMQERYEVKQKLYEIESNFTAQYFIRINKSYVINLRWIQEIIPWFGGRLLLKIKEIGEELEVSRNYVKAFKKSLGI